MGCSDFRRRHAIALVARCFLPFSLAGASLPVVEVDGQRCLDAARLEAGAGIALKTLPGRDEHVACGLERCAPVKPVTLLRLGRTNEAQGKLEQARALDAGNWRIRKQIWALRNPGKFYGPDGIDWSWQKEQIARERDDAK